MLPFPDLRRRRGYHRQNPTMRPASGRSELCVQVISTDPWRLTLSSVMQVRKNRGTGHNIQSMLNIREESKPCLKYFTRCANDIWYNSHEICILPAFLFSLQVFVLKATVQEHKCDFQVGQLWVSKNYRYDRIPYLTRI